MRSIMLSFAGATVVATSAGAAVTGVTTVSYQVTAEDFGGASVSAYVTDLYVTTDAASDVLLNVYDLTLGSNAPSSFFQSATSTGWLAQNAGGIFDTEALQIADSFVTIGGFGADGRQAPGAGDGSAIDPNFGGNTAAAPGALAGWYNGSPPSLNGAAMTYDSGVTGVLIGRFSSEAGEVDLTGSVMSFSWNSGLGTDTYQGTFTVEGSTPVVPGIGGVMALAGIGLIGRRQRR